MDRPPVSRRRRDLLKGAGAATALSTFGVPAIVSGQSEAVRFGHLTPRTGGLTSQVSVPNLSAQGWVISTALSAQR